MSKTKPKITPGPIPTKLAEGLIDFHKLAQLIIATRSGDDVGEDGGSLASPVIELADAVVSFVDSLDGYDGANTDGIFEVKSALDVHHAGMGPLRGLGHH